MKESNPISTFPFPEFLLVKCLAICPCVSVLSYLALIVLISYQVMHTFCIRQATPDGILSCAMTHIIQSQHAMPSTDKLRGSLDVESRSYHASAALKSLLSSFAFLSLSLPLFFSISGTQALPSGLCRSSWQAPFEASHSCSSSQDCTLISWLCSINNSPPGSFLPSSSLCSSPLSIYSSVRGGSVCACMCV